MDNDFIRQVVMKGLTLGVELGPERVSREICPQCPFSTAFCLWLLELWAKHPDTSGFVCKGMRAWVTKSN